MGGWACEKNDEEAIQCRARLIIHPGVSVTRGTSCGGESLPQERPIMTAVTAWKRLFIPLKSDLMLPSVSPRSCQEPHRPKTRGEKLFERFMQSHPCLSTHAPTGGKKDHGAGGEADKSVTTGFIYSDTCLVALSSNIMLCNKRGGL